MFVEGGADLGRASGQHRVYGGVGGDAGGVRRRHRCRGQRDGRQQLAQQRRRGSPHERRRITSASPTPSAPTISPAPASQRAVVSGAGCDAARVGAAGKLAGAGASVVLVPSGAAWVRVSIGTGCSGSPPPGRGG